MARNRKFGHKKTRKASKTGRQTSSDLDRSPALEPELIDEFEEEEEVEELDELSPPALLSAAGVLPMVINIRQVETETVQELYDQYKDDDLDIRPPFQRLSVWDVKKKSRFIESLLLDFPIPLIFLAEEAGNPTRRFVVDGQQRLRALFEFIDGQFFLKGLGDESTLEDKTFPGLGKIAKLLRRRHLRLITIKESSDPDVAFDLFERINKGSKPLNQQELRNCKYHRSTYNTFLVQTSQEKVFRELRRYDPKEPHPRMHDVEDVLRFMAFLDQKYTNHPDKRAVKFLNEQMERGKSLKPAQRAQHLKDFRKAVRLCRTVFGRDSFRRFRLGNEEEHNGRWESRVNKALMDVELYWFARSDAGKVTTKAGAIRDAAVKLMCDSEFENLLSESTSAHDRVVRRFELWKAMLDSVLGPHKKGRAYYTFEEKRKAFERDPHCKLCGEVILEVGDAHMDHILPKARGGTTTRKNAALTHQWCNQHKGARH